MMSVAALRTALIASLVGALELLCRTGVISRQTLIAPSDMLAALVSLLASGQVKDDIVRTLVCVVSDAATGREPELAIHLRMALREGWTEAELTEVLLHLLGYVGAPLTRDAMLVASRVFAEMGGSEAARP